MAPNLDCTSYDRGCRCAECMAKTYADPFYQRELEFVRALSNPVPKPLAAALGRQWQHIDIQSYSLWFSPPNLRVHELEQAPQQKPLARLK